jgi:hypothetical protein
LCAALLVTGPATGCSSAEPPPTWLGAVEINGTTRTVRTISGSVWGTPRHLEEISSIGVEEGADEYVLGRVVGLAARAGRILLINQKPIVVRVYDIGGEFLFNVGRRGSGPGEYLGPMGIAVRPDDGTIIVRDSALSRLNLYSPEGRYLESWRLRTGISTYRPLIVTEQGTVFTEVRLPRQGSAAVIPVGMAEVTAAGTGTDTLRVPEPDREPWIIVFDTSEGPLAMPVPFSPERVWAMSPVGEMLSGMSDRYRVDVVREDGQRLRIERSCDPIPFLEEEWQWYRDRVEARIRVSVPGWEWRGPQIPTAKPFIRALAVDQSGRIWVVRPGPGRRLENGDPTPESALDYDRAPLWGETFFVDIFDRDGRYLGKVGLPNGVQTAPPLCFDGEIVIAAFQNEMGIPSVKSYRLTGITPRGNKRQSPLH